MSDGMAQNAFEKEDFALKKVVNIPNCISMARIIASVPLTLAIFYAGFPMSVSLMGLTVLFMATDFADGYLARKLNQKTKVGQILDPIGDKLLALGLMGALLAHGLLPLWSLILPARDIAAVFVAKNHIKKNSQIMKPNNIARTKTFMLSVAMAGCIVLGKFTLLSMLPLLASCGLAISEVGIAVYNIKHHRALNDTTHLNQYLVSKFPFLKSFFKKEKLQDPTSVLNEAKIIPSQNTMKPEVLKSPRKETINFSNKRQEKLPSLGKKLTKSLIKK